MGSEVSEVAVVLEHPVRVLRPNGHGQGGHWAVKARAVKRARFLARWVMLARLRELPPGAREEFAPVWYGVTWFYKGVAPDADNCLAACKAYLDGCADALGVDDRVLECSGVRRVHDAKLAGKVEIRFTE